MHSDEQDEMIFVWANVATGGDWLIGNSYKHHGMSNEEIDKLKIELSSKGGMTCSEFEHSMHGVWKPVV